MAAIRHISQPRTYQSVEHISQPRTHLSVERISTYQLVEHISSHVQLEKALLACRMSEMSCRNAENIVILCEQNEHLTCRLWYDTPLVFT